MTQQRRERLARRLTLDGAVQWHVLCYQVEPGRIRKSCSCRTGVLEEGGRVQGQRQSTMLSALQCCGCGEQSYVASSQLSKKPPDPIDLDTPI